VGCLKICSGTKSSKSSNSQNKIQVLITTGTASRLHEHRATVKRKAEAVEQAEAKERLRRATLGSQVQGPDMNAFLRQLGADKVCMIRMATRQLDSIALLIIGAAGSDSAGASA
jgi:hypothetical protein